MTIIVKIKNVYGNETLYPISEDAQFLAQFKGQKTLTQRDIHIIEQAGHTVEIIP